MTLSEMLSLLGVYLNDINNSKHRKSVKVTMLNDTQRTTCLLLHRHVLRELHVKVTSQSLDSEGKLYLPGLSHSIFEEDVGIRVVNITDGKPCYRISIDEWQDKVRAGRSFNSAEPKYYVWGDYIYVKPYNSDDIASGDIEEGVVYYNSGYSSVVYNGTAYADGETFTGVDGVTDYTEYGNGSVIINNTVDIHLLKNPATMVLGATAASNVDCGLRESRHPIVLGLACEPFVDESPKAKRAYDIAIKMIETLNSQRPPTDTLIHNVQEIDEEALFDIQTIYLGSSGTSVSEETSVNKIEETYTPGVGGVEAWDWVYVSEDNTILPIDDSSYETSNAIGIVEIAAAEGVPRKVVTQGIVENPSWSLTINGSNKNRLYNDTVTSTAKLSETPPTTVGKWAKYLGRADAATKIYVAPAAEPYKILS